MTADRADRADFAGSRGAGHARWQPGEGAGLRVAQGHRLTGTHAAPWEQGVMICQSLLGTLRLWREER